MMFFAFIQKGGPVNWVLFGCAFFALVLSLERALYFIQTRSSRGRPSSQAARMRKKAASLQGVSEKNRIEELERLGVLLQKEMHQGLWLLSIITVISPSLGLLGTVTGLIKSFQQMGLSVSQVNIQDLSSGIWEAMLTTASGLVVSIPTLVSFRLFHHIAEQRSLAIAMAVPLEGSEEEDESYGEMKNHYVTG